MKKQASKSGAIPAAIAGYAEHSERAVLVRPHWILLATGLFALGWGLALAAIAASMLAPATSQSILVPWLLTGLAGLMAFHALLFAAIKLVAYYFSYLLITDTHLVTMTGIARQVRALELDKADLSDADETLLGRILGYGTLDVTGFSGRGVARFPVPNPHQLTDRLRFPSQKR